LTRGYLIGSPIFFKRDLSTGSQTSVSSGRMPAAACLRMTAIHRSFCCLPRSCRMVHICVAFVASVAWFASSHLSHRFGVQAHATQTKSPLRRSLACKGIHGFIRSVREERHALRARLAGGLRPPLTPTICDEIRRRPPRKRLPPLKFRPCHCADPIGTARRVEEQSSLPITSGSTSTCLIG
jgi:hypothetical protein